LVTVHRTADESAVGVIREVLQVCLSKASWEKNPLSSLLIIKILFELWLLTLNHNTEVDFYY
jgi:hypothetical protein